MKKNTLYILLLLHITLAFQATAYMADLIIFSFDRPLQLYALLNR